VTTETRPQGDVLLDDVADAIRRYCVLPDDHALTGVVLWVACTYLTDCFEYAPRLVIRSAEKGSGKSRLLEVIDALSYEPLRAVNATVSYIFRSLDRDTPPTLLIDEADTIFGSKKVSENNEELRGLLNAGFQRGLTFGRTVGPQHEPKDFATFAMAALAGIGRMPDTIEDRAVVVVMRRRKPSEVVHPYRTRRDRPALKELAHDLTDWADEVAERAEGYEPPHMGVEDRAADTWEPLITVADMAGGRWPELAREAATAMVANAADEAETASLNIKLLADIKTIFNEENADFITSSALCGHLHNLEESPWAQFELNPSKLGRRLKEYGIRTGHNTTKTVRGYRLEDFLDTWDRYIPTAKVSEDVQGRPQAADQHERRDTFNDLDTFKASVESKASHHNPRSEGVRTGLDTFGHLSAENSDQTGKPAETPCCRVCGQSLIFSRTGVCSRLDDAHDIARMEVAA